MIKHILLIFSLLVFRVVEDLQKTGQREFPIDRSKLLPKLLWNGMYINSYSLSEDGNKNEYIVKVGRIV